MRSIEPKTVVKNYSVCLYVCCRCPCVELKLVEKQRDQIYTKPEFQARMDNTNQILSCLGQYVNFFLKVQRVLCKTQGVNCELFLGA